MICQTGPCPARENGPEKTGQRKRVRENGHAAKVPAFFLDLIA
jgi:hypothetical protein